MCFREAKEIAAAFGKLVEELNDPKRYSVRDHRKDLPFSLPIQRLHHSKPQIQTALAIIIARLTIELAIRPSKQNGATLSAAVMTSGELQYFGSYPVPNRGTDDSVYVYAGWRETCERCSANIVGKQSVSNQPDGWPSPQALAEYWQVIDSLVPRLLAEPALVAARNT